jgi:hypothetical protein
MSTVARSTVSIPDHRATFSAVAILKRQTAEGSVLAGFGQFDNDVACEKGKTAKVAWAKMRWARTGATLGSTRPNFPAPGN